MTKSGEESTSEATTSSPPGEVFDAAIDLQYSNGKVEAKVYAEEPWNHSSNLVSAYLSSRETKKNVFEKGLRGKDPNEERDKMWEKVEREKNRIGALRKRFRGNRRKNTLMEELDNCRKSLRDAMWEGIGKREEEVRQRLKPEDKRRNAELGVLKRLRSEGQQRGAPEERENGESERWLDGFKAGAMYFERKDNSWRGISHSGYEGQYPNQKLEVRHMITQGKRNPLAIDCDREKLRYFHFPANSMEWIEKAMTILHGGDLGDNDLGARTGNVLSRGFWGGQMYGSGERGIATHVVGHEQKPPIHARHMRPRCSMIPRGRSSAVPSQSKNVGKNIAIFLPYLHWEASSRRARMFEIVDEVTRPPGKKEKPRKDIAKVAEDKKKGSDAKEPMYRNKIGDYLMAVAKVAEEMDYEDDEGLLRASVSATPPLHVRRTLDQYYFPTLENTSARDRDQVVYRGTKKGRARIVMVDQLWLWIINDIDTIITSFPRRWGRNKPDPSGVHKSLRVRLEHEEISSIYHLALIIIDQCSRVFFDRTKPLDQRPEVMDLVASAIGNVTEETAVGYENFWRNLSIDSYIMSSANGSSLHHKRLDININPEGVVLQEAQDIAEELRIMGRVFTDQAKVTKVLKRYLEPSESHYQGGAFANIQSPTGQTATDMHQAAHEAAVLLENIEDRQAEIKDLEDSAVRTCEKLERLLSLKQQQASIVEAKAALRRADESVKQGRAIMAFTLVTIFFLPLGFIATFFGMNNREINNAEWMSLNEQIRYMFVVTIAVVIVIVSIAFSALPRAITRLLVHVPFLWFGELTGLSHYYKASPLHHERLDIRTSRFLGKLEVRKHKHQNGSTSAKTDEAGGMAQRNSLRRRLGIGGGSIATQTHPDHP